MNTTQLIKLSVAAMTFLLSAESLAGSNMPLIKEKPHNIYHVIKDKPLLAVTNQIANRSGIVFKVNADLEHDLINQKLAAADWRAALEQLLINYNFIIQSENKLIKTVLITGRRGNGTSSSLPLVPENALLVVAPNYGDKIPGRYKDFAPGSVFNVTLPMEQLNAVAVGGEVTLDLPIGQYNIKHDNRVSHEDGSSTWAGYLGDEGQGYRVYLSQGEAGIIGNVYTPDGAYNIETVDGETVLVDIDNSGLDSAGYDHDEAEAAPETLALMENGLQMADVISDLQQAAEKARATADALTKEAKALLTQYQQALANSQNARNTVLSLQSQLAATRSQLNAVRALAKTSKNNPQMAATVNQLAANLTDLSKQLKLANDAWKQVNKTAALAKTAYNKTAKLAATAEANAKKAEAAYAAKRSEITTTTSSTNAAPNSEIELMVLYTTVNQTAAYAKQRIQYLVDISNQAYKDSGINMTLRLVHTRATHYAENNANSQALSDLANDVGAFAGTAALRNQYGADLVALFRPLYAQTAGSCGTAYVGFANGSNANARLGFGTIGDGYSKDAESNYYCGTNTFTHEIGHNLGNVHDREYSSFSGKFDYSYAWGVSGKFGTIMSYYGPSVMLFSTPNLATECAGTACGFAEGDAKASDQTKTINYTAPFIANYRSSTISAPVIQ